MWKEDARLSLNLYGDKDSYIFLSIEQSNLGRKSGIGNRCTKPFGEGIRDATPEAIGDAVAKYLRENFWKEHESEKITYRGGVINHG